MPPSVKSFLRIEFESNLKIYVNSSLSFYLKVNQNLHILLFFVSWEKKEFELFFFFLFRKKENWHWYMKIMLADIIIVYYLCLLFVWYYTSRQQ